MSEVYIAEHQDSSSINLEMLERYTRSANEKRNPLLHNKGRPPGARLPFRPEEEKKRVSICVEAVDPPPRKTDTIISNYSEAMMSDTSEFRVTERNSKLISLMCLPLFEVHSTLQLIASQRSLKNIHKANPTDTKIVYSTFGIPMKSRSIQPQQSSLKTHTQKLTPEEIEYLEISEEFKMSFLMHAFNRKTIYMQYVALSKSDISGFQFDSLSKHKAWASTLSGNYLRDPKHNGRKTLALDLDETLILASCNPLSNHEFFFTPLCPTPQPAVYVKLRPYLSEFLKDMAQYYEIAIYTASEKAYADPILDFIDKKGDLFSFRLYKEHCLLKSREYLFKPLDIFYSNREPKEVLIVDNRVRNFAFDIRNGIPIPDFDGDPEDIELSLLGKYLREIISEPDVRVRIKQDIAEFLLGHYKSN